MKEIALAFPYVFIGGGIGATLRYLFSLLGIALGLKFWVSTLFVNLLGTAIFCWSIKYFQTPVEWSQQLLRVGILGSLTTFSTFSYEVALSFKQGQYLLGMSILLLNIVFGVFIAISFLR